MSVRNQNLEAIAPVLATFSVHQTTGARPSMAACPYPTRCWLACNVRGGAASTIEVDGWEVRSIRLGRG